MSLLQLLKLSFYCKKMQIKDANLPTISFKNILMKNQNKKNLGIIKHLSIFLPHKTLDLMYKAIVLSHLDYCDTIYHITSKQTQLGVNLNALMEKTGNNSMPSSTCCHRCVARFVSFKVL